MIKPAPNPGLFQACVNRKPLVVKSLFGKLTLRPEIAATPQHWIWKVIADGKVGRRSTSIGLFLDHDIEPGTYDLINDKRVRIVYNDSPHWENVIYHSANFQTGTLILHEVDLEERKLAGQFSFSMSAVNFEVTDGAFDLYCVY
jgi:hypothetical protein